MEKDIQEDKEAFRLKKASELFSLLKKKQHMTVRDDQYGFSTVLDAVRQFRDRRYRFRLIDTGRFDSFELEWIAAQGADLYTSDEIRSSVLDLELLSAATRKGNAVVACLISGDLETEEEGRLSSSDWMNVGRSGVYLHLTNRQRPRDIQQVIPVAHNCTQGGSWVVYYHHGVLEPPLLELGRSGAWIHIQDTSLEDEESRALVRDIARSARSAGSNLVLHWDGGSDYSLLEDIVKAGAVVLFKSPLFDYRSPYKVLEKGIGRMRLDFRAYYLHPSVLP